MKWFYRNLIQFLQVYLFPWIYIWYLFIFYYIVLLYTLVLFWGLLKVFWSGLCVLANWWRLFQRRSDLMEKLSFLKGESFITHREGQKCCKLPLFWSIKFTGNSKTESCKHDQPLPSGIISTLLPSFLAL